MVKNDFVWYKNFPELDNRRINGIEKLIFGNVYINRKDFLFSSGILSESREYINKHSKQVLEYLNFKEGSDDRNFLIFSRYVFEGLTYTALADEYNLSKECVRQIVNKELFKCKKWENKKEVIEDTNNPVFRLVKKSNGLSVLDSGLNLSLGNVLMRNNIADLDYLIDKICNSKVWYSDIKSLGISKATEVENFLLNCGYIVQVS